jgi:hypothetical protein
VQALLIGGACDKCGEGQMIDKICWVLLGLIHVMPALALFKPALLEKMYGVAPGSDNFTLMHHRAALFLVIVVISLWAMFRPEVRPLAAVAVGISMGSFILIWWLSGASPALKSIAVADLVGLPILLFAGCQTFKVGG